MTYRKYALFALALGLAGLAGTGAARAEDSYPTTYLHPLCAQGMFPWLTTGATHCTTIHARIYEYAGAQDETTLYLDRIEAKMNEACTVEVSKDGGTPYNITTDPNNENAVSAMDSLPSGATKFKTPFTVKFRFPSKCAVQVHARRTQIGPDEIRYFHIQPSDVTGEDAYFDLNMHGATVHKTN